MPDENSKIKIESKKKGENERIVRAASHLCLIFTKSFTFSSKSELIAHLVKVSWICSHVHVQVLFILSVARAERSEYDTRSLLTSNAATGCGDYSFRFIFNSE